MDLSNPACGHEKALQRERRTMFDLLMTIFYPFKGIRLLSFDHEARSLTLQAGFETYMNRSLLPAPNLFGIGTGPFGRRNDITGLFFIIGINRTLVKIE